MSIEFLDFLKRERDISIKAMSSGGKMAFRLSPTLSQWEFSVLSENVRNEKLGSLLQAPPLRVPLPHATSYFGPRNKPAPVMQAITKGDFRNKGQVTK